MNIIACQDDFIMTSVATIDLDITEVRFEDDQFYQIWRFETYKEAKEAFTAVWKEIHSSVRTGIDCFLDEALIKAQVEARRK